MYNIQPINNIKTEKTQTQSQTSFGPSFVEGLAEAVAAGRITLPVKTELDQTDLSKNKLTFESPAASEEEQIEDHISGLIGRIKKMLEKSV